MSLLINVLCVLCVGWTDATLDEIFTSKSDTKVIKQAAGIEFSNISRSTLLQILSAIEEEMHLRELMKKSIPMITAQFANNKYTRPFIY
ncbi:unnamed protein product, partial [Iphiclides podalirius]